VEWKCDERGGGKEEERKGKWIRLRREEGGGKDEEVMEDVQTSERTEEWNERTRGQLTVEWKWKTEVKDET